MTNTLSVDPEPSRGTAEPSDALMSSPASATGSVMSLTVTLTESGDDSCPRMSATTSVTSYTPGTSNVYVGATPHRCSE